LQSELTAFSVMTNVSSGRIIAIMTCSCTYRTSSSCI